MLLTTTASTLSGRVEAPGSKSHTVRAILFALLAEGESRLHRPLESGDTRAALAVASAFGAEVRTGPVWRIQGLGPRPAPPENVIDVLNSGTTLYIAMGIAALAEGATVFTGDAQIRRRPAGNLMRALSDLGAHAFSTRRNDCAPLVVEGRLNGGETSIECPTSQYLTSLLISCPLADGGSRLRVPLLHERPYVHMTLRWLKELGIRVEHDDTLASFHIPGGQRYPAFDKQIPGDFSSATFFLCAAALTGGTVEIGGLDLEDSQGDKAVVDYLRAMGASVTAVPGGVRVEGGSLRGCELDLNATPDALPALAVTACFAEGTTRLVNVPQARLKETDRIAVMARELSSLGACVTELPDGLVIGGGGLRGGRAHGHHDHRVIMSLCLAGLRSDTPVTVDTAEAVAVTFPAFPEAMASLGAKIEARED